MNNSGLPPLIIGDLTIDPPFILGGMGVRISDHKLASAVADLGMAGTIASVGLFDKKTDHATFVTECNKALAKEIRLARQLTEGPIGVNIMFALTNFEDLVKTSVEEKVDYIISGAGLPLNLPEFTKGTNIKLIPIVSSAKAAGIICKRWLIKYDRLPDAFIVEGVQAGGHLGFNKKEIDAWTPDSLKNICIEVIKVADSYSKTTEIPVIAAGGVFDGNDIASLLNAGVRGVQLATRFIATDECTAPENFKRTIVRSKKEDMIIIDSPVGLPGRVIKTPFSERIAKGEKIAFKCTYHCLKTCDPSTSRFCIADALTNAQHGNIEKGIIMAGYNAFRIDKIVPVKDLVNELVKETAQHLNMGFN